MPHALHRESAEGQGHETEDTDAPGSSAAHSKPASQGWGRLKKVKLAAQADGSQDVGSKRKRDQDPGSDAICASMTSVCMNHAVSSERFKIRPCRCLVWGSLSQRGSSQLYVLAPLAQYLATGGPA